MSINIIHNLFHFFNSFIVQISLEIHMRIIQTLLSRSSGKLKHTSIKLIVFSMLCYETEVVSLLDYTSMLKHHYRIGIAYCRQSVSYNKYGSSVHERVHSLFDHRLCSGIYGAGGLIKYKHRRIRCSTQPSCQCSEKKVRPVPYIP